MVFCILKIRSGVVTLKEWYGCCLSDTLTLVETYNAFSTGEIDKNAPLADRWRNPRILVGVGRTKHELTQSDPSVQVGEIVSFLGPYIEFTVSENLLNDNTYQTNATVNAFDILMSATNNACHLPEKKNETHGNKHIELYDDIIEWLSHQNVGFIKSNVDSLGKSLVNTLCDVLWYVDGNHHTLASRSCPIPDELGHFNGYNNPTKYKRRKRDASSLEEAVIRQHAISLSLLGSYSYMKRDQWKGVACVISKFGENLKKYADYLVEKKVGTSKNQERTFVGEKQKWDVLGQKSNISPTIQARYRSLHTSLLQSECYSPILLNDYAPGDARRRYDYINGLVTPVKCIKYTYTGVKEHLTFIWKVDPSDKESAVMNKNSQISAGLMKEFPKYHTRAMRREFLSMFGRVIHSKTAFMREAYRRLTGDSSASLNFSESEVDKRISDILDSDDADLIWDLRVNNSGQPEKYTKFLEVCQTYISSEIEQAVDERRHDKVDDGDVITHLADAFSVRDLHEQVAKQCPEDTPIPSKEWLRYQFWPRNTHFKSSERYKGRIKIKFMIQSRQFRKKHVDMHYASALFRYQKEFAIKYREHVTFVCMDDKHKVKVGEPGYPVAMAERGKSVLVAMGKKFEVADHDFTKFSLTPSVSLIIDVPSSIDETFYGGKTYVGFKENAFQPSSPWRHAAELTQVLTEVENKPILLMYCDGGPDHRVTYLSVQISIINMFLNGDYDMVSVVRTPPGNSWKNPAERIMSVLNLGFQSVGLMREKTISFENKLDSVSSVSGVRELGEKHPTLVDEVNVAMTPVKTLLEKVVKRLKWKEQNLNVYEAATEDQITDLRRHILSVDKTLEVGDTTQNSVKTKSDFQNFLTSHCQIAHYMFSVKKCGKAVCDICKKPKLPADVFESLCHLPHPEPMNTEKYKEFGTVYGTTTSEKFRPSLAKSAESSHGIPFPPSAQTAKNVEMVVYCSECEKPRVIYSKHVLRGRRRTQAVEALNDLQYSCGSSFRDIEVPEDHVLRTIYVKKNLTCLCNMELTYFSAGYEPVCYYCGQNDDENITEGPTTHYPLCANCSNKPPIPKRIRVGKKNVNL